MAADCIACTITRFYFEIIKGVNYYHPVHVLEKETVYMKNNNGDKITEK